MIGRGKGGVRQCERKEVAYHAGRKTGNRGKICEMQALEKSVVKTNNSVLFFGIFSVIHVVNKKFHILCTKQ